MIIIKDKDTYYFAYSIHNDACVYQADIDLSERDNCLFWHTRGEHHNLVGISSPNDRLPDLLRYSSILDCELNASSLDNAVDQIRELIENSNCFADERGKLRRLGFDLCIASKDTCYVIKSFDVIDKVDILSSIDENEPCIELAYELNKHTPNIYERIGGIGDSIQGMSTSYPFPLAVMNSRDDSYVVISKENGNTIIKGM